MSPCVSGLDALTGSSENNGGISTPEYRCGNLLSIELIARISTLIRTKKKRFGASPNGFISQ
jgi:hypothetical protein